MKNKKPQWVILALLTVVALVLAAVVLPPLAKPKARASRISAVNHVASVSMTLPRTNRLAAPTPATKR
jgi:asparagine N-glycosylation enzyme membrane subunit Stt3